MADYNENNVARLKHIAALGTRVKSELDTTVKYISVEGSTVSFFKTADGSGTAAFTVDFPEEIFLDQAGTTLVDNFSWSSLAYPGSTNPGLDGKTVLVLAVRGDKATAPTVKYSFVDVSKLIDTYTEANAGISIAGYSVGVNVSTTATNILSIAGDGLLAELKLGSASAGNVASFGAGGYIQDSGLSIADLDFSGKADKVTGATAGNIATLDANGNLVDSGVTFASDTDVNTMITGIFGASS